MASLEVSPNLSPHVSRLKEVGIKVHGVVGTADVLAPDALVFKAMCEKYGIVGDWLVWQGILQDFIIRVASLNWTHRPNALLSSRSRVRPFGGQNWKGMDY